MFQVAIIYLTKEMKTGVVGCANSAYLIAYIVVYFLIHIFMSVRLHATLPCQITSFCLILLC